jgi:hypothetical protein
MRDRLLPKSLHGGRLALFLGLLSTALAGCGGKPIQPESFIKTVAREEAMIMPPPSGPAIVSVVERRHDNAISQDVHLATSAATPGQNMLRIDLYGTSRSFSHSSNTLGSTMITQAKIASEMRQRLPGVRMVKSNFYVQNNYGPFGYAFGRRGADLCLYAWQQIRSRAAATSPLANYGVIQIRLRLCETGSTEARLLATMYNFTITASVDSMGWNPYGAARGFNADVGGAGAPIYPRPSSAEPIVQTLPPRRTVVYAPQVSARRLQPAAQAPAPVTAAEIGSPQRPLVPGPSGRGEAHEDASSNRTTVPSPGGEASGIRSASSAPRVTVPSPSCTMTTDGTDVVCR